MCCDDVWCSVCVRECKAICVYGATWMEVDNTYSRVFNICARVGGLRVLGVNFVH